ncbi:hypothetical protein D3879_14630 [Pseudomonas cavernicola]|uniref:Phage protein n=1 Tax=Pseudomonas cavernicola TaxID=2320866 RepID=A0A418XEF6_9PSED|nr:phage tail assembly chaperone [Pseudomonas cavernicola]RJG10914.1 hypothetical protein D3879_14630 [Pseudomonas cavernicola]
MTSKFKLDVAPTFKATVNIPVHGGDTVPVEFEFKHRTKDQVNEWLGSLTGRADVEVLQDVLAGWELDDVFNEESIGKLVQNYAGAGGAIVAAYVDELLQARRKN